MQIPLLSAAQQSILDRFFATPAAKKLEQQIEDERKAKREKLEKQLTALREERAPKIAAAKLALDMAKRDFADHMAGVGRKENAVHAASVKLHRAGKINWVEIKQLEAQLAELL